MAFWEGRKCDVAGNKNEFKQSRFLAWPPGLPGPRESLLSRHEPSELLCLILSKDASNSLECSCCSTHAPSQSNQVAFHFQLWSAIYSATILILSWHYPSRHLDIYLTCPVLFFILIVLPSLSRINCVVNNRILIFNKGKLKTLEKYIYYMYTCVLLFIRQLNLWQRRGQLITE